MAVALMQKKYLILFCTKKEGGTLNINFLSAKLSLHQTVLNAMAMPDKDWLMIAKHQTQTEHFLLHL